MVKEFSKMLNGDLDMDGKSELIGFINDMDV